MVGHRHGYANDCRDSLLYRWGRDRIPHDTSGTSWQTATFCWLSGTPLREVGRLTGDAGSTLITDWDGIAAMEGTPQRVTLLYLRLTGVYPERFLPELGESKRVWSKLTLLDTHELTGSIPAEFG